LDIAGCATSGVNGHRRTGVVTAVQRALIVAAVLLVPALSASAMSGRPMPAPVTPPPPTGAPGPPTPAQPAAPTTIPVPEVALRAEEVTKLIRDLEASLLPSPVLGTIEGRLPEISERLVSLRDRTGRELEVPTSGTLNELTDQWRTSRDLLLAYVETLAQRGRSIEEGLKRVTTLRSTWTQARTDAGASRAPKAVIERIDGVLTALAQFRDQLLGQRAVTLVLQDRVAREVAQCEAMLARIAAARIDVAGRLLERDSLPLWDTAELARGSAELPDRLRQAVAADVAHLAQVVREERWKRGLQLVLFIGLTLLMLVARRMVANGGAVFTRPVSAGLLLTILTTWWTFETAPPRTAVAVVEILLLVPALRILKLYVAPGFTPQLNVLGGLFVADLLRHFASVVPLLEQQVFVLEMAAAIAVVGWEIRRRPASRPVVMRALLAVFTVALAAAIAGYMRLGVLLGAGVLGSGYLALILCAGVRAADGLVSLGLRVRPLSRLRSVERHRPRVEARAHGVLRIAGAVVWAVLALRYFGLWNGAVELAHAALGAELQRGSLSISVNDLLVFGLTVGSAFVLSGLIRFVLAEDVYPRLSVRRGLPSVLSTLLHYAILLVGFLMALAAVGVDFTKVTILAGAFGVGIGFGLQGVVNNFVSGLILLVERRIDVGDAVQVGDLGGQVQHMGMRACTVRTWDGAEVIVPNATLVSEKVANWTLSDRLRRIDVAVGVAYGTPPGQVMEILLSVARGHKQVLLEPAPIALLTGFGDSALRFELRVWTERFDLWVLTQSELSVAVYEALRASGIAIPFPQREVRLRS
jgi:small-conductance mechanosensitive channel